LPEYTIRPTTVKKQPSTDFIVIMHPSDMQQLNIKDNDYVKIENVIRKKQQQQQQQEEIEKIELFGLVINSRHRYSEMTSSDPSDPKLLKPGEIGLDQTYREALALNLGHKVKISKANARQNLNERFLSLLNYQKAVVRIQANAPYMEHKIPVVCLCEEMMSSIGAEYGDRINVESTDNKINAKTAKLTTSMQQFHDFILDKSNEKQVKPRLTEKYFLDPSDFGINSERLHLRDLIHPIFMDAIAMDLLSAHRLHPVKIYRSLWWDIQKKLNSFGSVSLIAFSITLSLFIQKPSIVSLIWSIILGVWGSWSVVTASLYRTKT
jgi:formylmethanofuran dehydrogenase subunit D